MNSNIFNKKEDLCVELVEHLEDHESLGQIIRHPLVFAVPYCDMMNAQLNESLRVKKEHFERCLREGNFSGAIYIHERPYRLPIFLSILDSEAERITDKIYWELVGEMWTDTENFWQNSTEWHAVFTDVELDREALMDEEDYKVYLSLPDLITVYRGGQRDTDRFGMAWTLDQEKATWFAERWNDPRNTDSSVSPRVWTGTVNKEDVLAYFGGRNESEILVFPEDVELTV